MHIDRTKIKEYPYNGLFKRFDDVTGEDIVIATTKCDIQQVTATDNNNNVQAVFKVFFPYDKSIGIAIKAGDNFSSEMNGLVVNGTITTPLPNQLGVCEVALRDLNV